VEFKDYLQTCADMWLKGQLYAPISSGLQSSGHGKSKTMYHFAKSNFVVYVCLRKEHDFGIPITSPISRQFLDDMIIRQTAKTFLFNLIKVTFEKIKELKEKYNNAVKKKEYKNIYEEFNQYQPWLIEHDTSSESVCKMKREIVSGILSKSQANSESNEDLKALGLNNNTPLFIFIDEAGSLLDGSKDKEDAKSTVFWSKFRVMRRAIIDLCKDLPIVFFLADTSGKVAKFVSNERSMSKSERKAANNPKDEGQVYPSFYKFLYNDQFVPEHYRPSLKDPGNLYTTIKNRNPKENLFLYGRPLWSNVKDPLELAEEKLICAPCWKNVKERDRLFASLAIISVRTTLSFNYNLIYDHELISRHLSTLFYVDKDRKSIATR
jgi:hypothetical protein